MKEGTHPGQDNLWQTWWSRAEDGYRKLVCAILVSNITYAARFYPPRGRRMLKFETMLNEARMVIPGLPMSTRKEELKKMPVSPVVTDLLKQQKAAHGTRELTAEGRKIQGFLGGPCREERAFSIP